MTATIEKSKHKVVPKPKNSTKANRSGVALRRRERVLQLTTGGPVIRIVHKYERPHAEVTMIRYYRAGESSYSVCPGCAHSIEREYQNYCSFCGQKLRWNQFMKGNITIQRIGHTEEDV